MNIRLACLGLLLALMPLSVDVPGLRDSSGGHETRFEAAGNTGRFSIVSHGCEGQVLDEVRTQVRGGALAIEHEFPSDLVLGVRGGVVNEQVPASTRSYAPHPAAHRTNRYWNPHVAFEGRSAGIGVGYLHAERHFLLTEHSWINPEVSGHVRFGNSEYHLLVRFMEDLPLESDGYAHMEYGFHPARNVEMAAGLGLLGPYDGTTIGLRGRLWITPAAALQVRASLGGLGQYHAAAGVSARLPGPDR